MRKTASVQERERERSYPEHTAESHTHPSSSSPFNAVLPCIIWNEPIERQPALDLCNIPQQSILNQQQPATTSKQLPTNQDE